MAPALHPRLLMETQQGIKLTNHKYNKQTILAIHYISCVRSQRLENNFLFSKTAQKSLLHVLVVHEIAYKLHCLLLSLVRRSQITTHKGYNEHNSSCHSRHNELVGIYRRIDNLVEDGKQFF